MADHHPKQKAKQSKASLIVLITLALLLMIGTGILIIRLPEDEAFQLPEESGGNGSESLAGFTCDASEAPFLYPYKDKVIRLAADRISCLDLSGHERYSVDIEMEAPFVEKNGSWLMVADQKGPDYVMLSESGEVYRGSLDGPIVGLAVHSDGTAALIQDQKDRTGIVSVLEAQTGRLLFDCFFPESGYVLSVAFSPDNSGFDVNLLNTDGPEPYPIIKRFALTGEQLGQRLPDLFDLYPQILYDPEGNLVLAGSSGLAALTYDQDTLLWHHSYACVHGVSSNELGTWVLAQKGQHEPVSLFLVDHKGNEKHIMDIGDRVIGPALCSRYLAVSTGSRVLIIDGSSGTLIREESFPTDIIRLDFQGEDNLIIVTANAVRRLPVQES